ncbi:MAG: DUF2141 domain-containing protein [Maribacter sp.]|jgi:uncharacterized protein (DUF2141 family)|nr:DUF2141 domain-containing protein [Maribacter sp.]MBT8314541.1 DUF2141 domain-containing protein [Maribacter sp.]
MIKHLFFVILFLVASFAFGQEVSLNVEIEGIKSEKGKILFSLFSDKNGFPGDMTKAFKKGVVHIEGGKAIIDLDLPPGTYAIMVFHDEDDNNELKTNWFGMPKEGVGNSNNHKGIPNYKKSVFKLYKNKTITINLWYA